jgi:hypothetical protein
LSALVTRGQSMDQCDHRALIRNGAIWTEAISSRFAGPLRSD